jgi:trafficking protein particle complex subunit 12
MQTYINEHVLPFELEVLRARCSYWAGDAVGYLDEVVGIMKECRSRARTCDSKEVRMKKGNEGEKEREKAMWVERAARMALIVASQLLEMGVRFIHLYST